jgi:hypothetical protein
MTYLARVNFGVGGGVFLVEIQVRRLDRQSAAAPHGVAGVDRKIEQRVFEFVGVDAGQPQAGAEDGFDRRRLSQGALEQLRHPRDQPVEIEGTRRQRLPP